MAGKNIALEKPIPCVPSANLRAAAAPRTIAVTAAFVATLVPKRERVGG
jgi:hypothetical protein